MDPLILEAFEGHVLADTEDVGAVVLEDLLEVGEAVLREVMFGALGGLQGGLEGGNGSFLVETMVGRRVLLDRSSGRGLALMGRGTLVVILVFLRLDRAVVFYKVKLFLTM